MRIELPPIAESEYTPLVRSLLDLIQQQQLLIQQLRDEIATLKGLPPRPALAPSPLEQHHAPPPTPGQKRPGSDKRPKTAQLAITRELVLPVADVPEGARFKGYEDFVVQELVLRPEVTRYRRERWLTPDGRTLVAELPPEIDGHHFGPQLRCYVLHQYHHQHVTQPLLLEELRQLGFDVSAGQVNALLTEGQERFHQEKETLLPSGLAVSSYVQVDDTGARHQGHNGYCLHLGNDLFAYFASTDSKSRLNFLEVLHRPHTDYVLNEMAQTYWQTQQLPAALVAALLAGPSTFADAAAWQEQLTACGVTGARQVRTATEGALLGSLVEHGVSPDLVVLSDGAPQFVVLRHALCWIHQERLFAKLVPFNESHRQAIEGVRQRLWALYAELKAYQQSPQPSRKAGLEARFDALCAWRTGFTTVDRLVEALAAQKAELLRVLEQPEVPLHNNVSESHLRDYVKKRKISGSTRSDAGRQCRDTFASLKKTCRCLGVNFWEYLQDRVRGLGVVPPLAELVRQRAGGTQAGEGTAALA